MEITRRDMDRFAPQAQAAWSDTMVRLSGELMRHYRMGRLGWVHFAGQWGAETNGLALKSMRENMRFTTAERIREVYGYRLRKALAENLDGCRYEYGTVAKLAQSLVNEPERLAAFVYGGREGTPVMCGKYIGRGPTQITHLSNYEAIEEEIRRQPGGRACPSLINEPEALESPEWGVRSAFADWHIKGLARYAEADDVDSVSAALNTGSASKKSITNNLDGRRRWTAKAKGVWPATSDRDLVDAKLWRQGDQSPEIKAAQEKLVALGYPCGEIDGAFGVLTRRAVVAFQSEHGLKVDGEIGPRTLDVLMTTAPAPVSEGRANATASDLAANGSTEVKAVQRVRLGAGLITALSSLLSFFGITMPTGDVPTTLTAINEAKQRAEEIHSAFGWLLSPGGLIVVGSGVAILIGVLIWFAAKGVERAKVEAYRKGLDLQPTGGSI